ncbi:MAG: hypothetical protein QM617_03000 [Comamonas sp.]
MNAHTMIDLLQTPAAAVAGPFLFAHGGLPAAEAMARVLTRFGVTESAALEPPAVLERLLVLRPTLVLVDFSAPVLDRAVELAAAIRRAAPQLPLVAVGSTADAAGTLAALRAGVQEFIDIAGLEAEVGTVLNRLLGVRDQSGRPARAVALLGARAGLGVTTLATSLATLLNQQATPPSESQAPAAAGAATSCGVALLDLGLPVADGMLYLDLRGDFTFVDAVQSLHRFDQTLVQTAFSQVGASGLRVLPLPQQLSALRHVSHADSSALVARLQAFFDWQVLDLGGFSNLDFMARVAREASDIWLVCDQSISAIVATAELVRGLAERGVDAQRLSVIVNAVDPRIVVTAEQVAQRLGVRLEGRIPERRVALVQAANVGRLLVQTQPRDPYSQAVQQLADGLRAQSGASSSGGGARELPRGLPALKSLLNRINHAKRH